MPLEFINPDTQTTATTNIATTIVNNTSQTNYIAFPVAIANPLINGWRIYNDGVTVPPVDGIDGTTTGITLTQETSAPLSSTGDFRLTKDAVNRQGLGISTDFTIANRHLSKVLQISFDYEVFSGTFADGDLRVYIIQDYGVTNTVIEPVNVLIQTINTGIRSRHLATFQTHVSLRNYRLCVHVASSSASAYTVDFNNFRVWETTQSIGAIITNWQNYTPTLGGFTSITNLDFQWRRVGSNMEIQGKWTNGANDSTEVRIPLPFGTIDSSRVPSIRIVGNGGYNASASTYFGTYILAEPNVSYLTMGIQTSTLNAISKITSNITGNNTYTIIATVPITGWGSSVAMSSDSGDSRIVAANYSGNPSLQGGNFVTFPTRQFDTHSAYNTSNGTYTCPVSGVYRISTTFGNSGTGLQVYINKNGSNVAYLFQTPANATYVTSGSANVICNAGDTIKLAIGGSNALYGSDATQNVSIERISAGSQVIATQETVSASYYSAATQTSLTTQINFGTRVYDTHGAVTTGSSWKFTAPMNGKYLITGALNCGGVITTVSLYKNNSLHNRHIAYINSNNGATSISYTLDLISGDYIDLRPVSSVTIAGGATLTGADTSQIQIIRVGN